jgi:hypothetical protein
VQNIRAYKQHTEENQKLKFQHFDFFASPVAPLVDLQVNLLTPLNLVVVVEEKPA